MLDQNKIAETKEKIAEEVKEGGVLLYMKGLPEAPQCGFSAGIVQILNTLGVEYEARNVLADEYLRQAIKEFSDWPTIPQLYVNQEFIGGSDIVNQLHQSGDLEKIVQAYKKHA